MMSKQDLLHDQELNQRVDEVLHYLWDPIKVSGIPLAREEYQSYVSPVLALLNKDAGHEQIASYLSEVVTNRMGLWENSNVTAQVVAVLLDWKESISKRRDGMR